jgi:transposase InsO family protein
MVPQETPRNPVVPRRILVEEPKPWVDDPRLDPGLIEDEVPKAPEAPKVDEGEEAGDLPENPDKSGDSMRTGGRSGGKGSVSESGKAKPGAAPTSAIDDLYVALREIPHGESAARKALFRAYAAYGSERTLQRLIAKRFGRRRGKRSDAGEMTPGLAQLAEQVAEKKIQAFAISGRWISTENAVKNLRDSGKTMTGMPSTSAINATIDKLGLIEVRRSYDVLHAHEAHDLHVADTSGSLIFRTVEYGDDPMVETCPANDAATYRNHPENTGRRQVYLYGMVDSHSGYLWAEYRAMPAPSSWAMASFLLENWRNSCIPRHFLTDHGRENLGAVDNLVTALGINRIHTKPGNPHGRGVIERAWRTVWQAFEGPLVLREGVGKKMSLSTLNGLLRDWLNNDYNQRPARLSVTTGRRSRYVTCSQQCKHQS